MDGIRKKLRLNWLRNFRKKRKGYRKFKSTTSLDDIFPDSNETYKSYSQPELSFTNNTYQQGKGRKYRKRPINKRKQRIKKRKTYYKKPKRVNNRRRRRAQRII
jgi:hypothetical protein